MRIQGDTQEYFGWYEQNEKNKISFVTKGKEKRFFLAVFSQCRILPVVESMATTTSSSLHLQKEPDTWTQLSH